MSKAEKSPRPINQIPTAKEIAKNACRYGGSYLTSEQLSQGVKDVSNSILPQKQIDQIKGGR